MAKIEPKIFDELKTALVSFGDKYFVGEELNRSKLTDDLRNYDEALLSKCLKWISSSNISSRKWRGKSSFRLNNLKKPFSITITGTQATPNMKIVLG